MDKLVITIVTTFRGVKKQPTAGMFIIEHSNQPGKTVEYKAFIESTTGERLSIQLFAKAMWAVNREKPHFDLVECHFDNRSVAKAFNNESYLKKWVQNGWKNAKSQEIANADWWKVLVKELEGITYEVSDTDTEYTKWMQAEVEKHLKSKIAQSKVAETLISTP